MMLKICAPQCLEAAFFFALAESVLGGLQRRPITLSGFLTFHFSDWN